MQPNERFALSEKQYILSSRKCVAVKWPMVVVAYSSFPTTRAYSFQESIDCEILT